MTDKEYVAHAWAVYNQDLGIEALSRIVAHTHNVKPGRLLHTIGGKLWRLRRKGWDVPLFNSRKKQTRQPEPDKYDTTCELARAVIKLMESKEGPIYELWESKEITSPTYAEEHLDGTTDLATYRLYRNDYEHRQAWEALLKDIQEGRVVGYLYDTQAEEREACPAVDVYLKAKAILI